MAQLFHIAADIAADIPRTELPQAGLFPRGSVDALRNAGMISATYVCRVELPRTSAA